MIEILTEKGARVKIESLGGNSFDLIVNIPGHETINCQGLYVRRSNAILFNLPGMAGKKAVSITEDQIAVTLKEFEKKIRKAYRFKERQNRDIAIAKAKEINNLVMYDWKLVDSLTDDLACDTIGYFTDSEGRIFSERFGADMA